MERIVARQSTRERLLDAATQLTIAEGWPQLTMEKVAAAAGLSRRTVYNEVGTKNDLAMSIMLRETAAFLAVVDDSLDDPDGDLPELVERTVTRVLSVAEAHPLVRAIFTSNQAAPTELLPLLTTRSEEVVETAAAFIEARVAERATDLGPERLHRIVESIVRLVVSHLIRPSSPPHEVGATLAWLVKSALHLAAHEASGTDGQADSP